MKNVPITTAAFTEIHAGQSLARFTPAVQIILADSTDPGATETAIVTANTPVYLPVGKATFAKCSSANTTLEILE